MRRWISLKVAPPLQPHSSTSMACQKNSLVLFFLLCLRSMMLPCKAHHLTSLHSPQRYPNGNISFLLWLGNNGSEKAQTRSHLLPDVAITCHCRAKCLFHAFHLLLPLIMKGESTKSKLAKKNLWKSLFSSILYLSEKQLTRLSESLTSLRFHFIQIWTIWLWLKNVHQPSKEWAANVCAD